MSAIPVAIHGPFPLCQEHAAAIRPLASLPFTGVVSEEATYLKAGYCINRTAQPSPLQPPFRVADLPANVELDKRDTYTLGPLLESFKQVANLQRPDVIMKGLRIAKVFRNKEGHVVTFQHKYDSRSFRAIEEALVEIYKDVFGETLKVHFSFEPREKGVWSIA